MNIMTRLDPFSPDDPARPLSLGARSDQIDAAPGATTISQLEPEQPVLHLTGASHYTPEQPSLYRVVSERPLQIQPRRSDPYTTS